MREKFQLGPYQLEVAVDFGPRITGLRRDGGAQVLADLGPDAVIEVVGGRPYVFRGGHRLWASPETPAVTYSPDDHRCQVSGDDVGFSITAPVDSAGVGKKIWVTLDDDVIVVEQTLTTTSARHMAAWGITQFPLGGLALISTAGTDTAPLPDRSLVLWPYTPIDDDRLRFREGVVEIEATGTEPLKIGMGPGPRRLGYLNLSHLFIKDVATAPAAPDSGAVAQIYVGQGFCELEALGDRTATDETSSAVLVERWTLVECDDPVEARRIVASGAASGAAS